VASWEKLLQYHPDFAQREALQQMIIQAKQANIRALDENGKPPAVE
jgi:hypothetical protein